MNFKHFLSFLMNTYSCSFCLVKYLLYAYMLSVLSFRYVHISVIAICYFKIILEGSISINSKSASLVTLSYHSRSFLLFIIMLIKC